MAREHRPGAASTPGRSGTAGGGVAPGRRPLTSALTGPRIMADDNPLSPRAAARAAVAEEPAAPTPETAAEETAAEETAAEETAAEDSHDRLPARPSYGDLIGKELRRVIDLEVTVVEGPPCTVTLSRRGLQLASAGTTVTVAPAGAGATVGLQHGPLRASIGARSRDGLIEVSGTIRRGTIALTATRNRAGWDFTLTIGAPETGDLAEKIGGLLEMGAALSGLAAQLAEADDEGGDSRTQEVLAFLRDRLVELRQAVRTAEHTAARISVGLGAGIDEHGPRAGLSVTVRR